MDEVIMIQDLQYTYSNRSQPTLSDITMTVKQGEFILITGKTGCGKSTLLKTLNGLIPHESGGIMSGRVKISGIDTAYSSIADLSERVGLLFQSADDQIFSTTVSDEVSFILENAGLPTEEITQRVREALLAVGLAGKEQSSVYTLSGGQKQRLALAAVLVAYPRVLALDEPISQVDPCGTKEILDLLKQLNEQMGITIILVEHRLHEVLAYCHRVIVMNEGKIVWDSPKQKLLEQPDILLQHGLRLPQAAALCWALGIHPLEIEIDGAVRAIRRTFPRISLEKSSPTNASTPVYAPELVAVQRVGFRYDGCDEDALNDISFSVSCGEIIAVMGTNGAGKSTLLQLLNGLFLSTCGEITVDGKQMGKQLAIVGQVMQNPDLMLFNSTVNAEIRFAGASASTVSRLIDTLSLNGLEREFPLALSRGQRLRVAIAAVLAAGPKLLLLDEPTTGQDFAHIEKIAAVVRDFADTGGAVVFCTHDVEAAARLASRVIVMSEGKIIRDGAPEQVFADEQALALTGLKPPQVILLSRAILSRVILSVEEVVKYVQQAAVGTCSGK